MTSRVKQSDRTEKPSLRAQRREDTRRRLFHVASELFAESGFDATTYDDIARAAGVARQTVFNHFPRKEDFAFEWGAGNRDLLDELTARPDFRTASATSRLLMIVRTMADVYESSAKVARVLLQAWIRAGGPVVEDPALLVGRFQVIIEAGQAAREFHPHLDATTAATLVRAAYFDALFRWMTAAPDDHDADLLAGMTSRLEVLLTGLRMPPAASLAHVTSNVEMPQPPSSVRPGDASMARHDA